MALAGPCPCGCELMCFVGSRVIIWGNPEEHPERVIYLLTGALTIIHPTHGVPQ